jgi:hypothetical protein
MKTGDRLIIKKMFISKDGYLIEYKDFNVIKYLKLGLLNFFYSLWAIKAFRSIY